MLRKQNLVSFIILLLAPLGITGCGESKGDDTDSSTGSSSQGAATGSGGTFGSGAAAGAGAAAGSGASAGSEGVGGSGADSGSGGMDSAGGSGGGQPEACSNQSPSLSVERIELPLSGSLGTPFDTDSEDAKGPSDWNNQYGKAPEIVPLAGINGLEILFQDQASDDHAYVAHVEENSGSYQVTHAYKVGSLGRIMGLAQDNEGNYFVATGVDEDEVVDAVYPPNKVHRPDIVRIVKFSPQGCVLMESDVDMARGAAKSDSEIIVNPMTAASSRLVFGGDRLLLVHGHNTEPDDNINGVRHQKAISTHINALDGTVTRTSTMWVSHSFDQRALFDGSGFVELHLGDAYPRQVALGHYNDAAGRGSYAAYKIKGATGANNTYSRLGGIVQSTDSSFGYMALFATERSNDTSAGMIRGTRDVALVRIKSNFVASQTDSSIVEEGGTTSAQMVTSADESVTNHLHWLTDLGANTHAERPRIVAIEDGKFIVLYERWTTSGTDTFAGTFALSIDNLGAVQSGPTEVPGKHHISRGDDIAAWAGKAVYVTGGDGKLYLNFVDADLKGTRVSLL